MAVGGFDELGDGYDSEEEFIDDTQFEDPEGYVDPISEEELIGDLLEQRPNESDSLDTVIIVDNIPQVGPKKLEKLKNIINKVFSKFGSVVNEYYPLDEKDDTKGFIFLEFTNASDAQHAVKTAHGYKLDKNHTFAVNSFSDFAKYEGVLDVWTRPDARPYEDRGNLLSWLLDTDCNDQYSVIAGEKVVILQHTPASASLVKKRDNWTDTFVMWSPRGTYLSTFHRQGIALWGGSEFNRLNRFNHTNVQLIDFSPCEKYVVTYAPMQDNPQDPQAIIIWDIRSGLKKRGFLAGNALQWPVFKWSQDGAYVGRQSGENLSFYETPNFGLLDKKSIKITGLKDFSWSPSQNLLAYWVPEDKDTPARVCIMEMPSRKEVRVKNLFNVSDCKMYWQKNGDYLCVKVERLTKSKKGMFYNLELFRMIEKDIPVDTLEMKDPVTAFEWEPNGSKFCVIHGEPNRINASFYKIDTKHLGHVTLLKEFEKRQANTIAWAPSGQFVVLCGLRTMNGVLEFIDTSDMTTMANEEHYMATDVEWDPSGRYFATSVSWWAHKVDNAYNIWSFQGRILQRHPLDQFCSFIWRPRPKSLLTEEDIRNVKKDMKKYQKQFEMKDRMSQTKASKELIEKRRELYNSFTSIRNRHQATYLEHKKGRMELRNGLDMDSLTFDEYDEETIEFFIKQEEEIIETESTSQE